MVDISGQKFGRLTALKPVGKDKYGAVIWLCECACGKKIKTLGGRLRNGQTKSCGCYKKDGTYNLAKTIDLIGQKYGRLTVLKYIGSYKFGGGLWLCQCECGKQKKVASSNLQRGGTKSCGCYHKDVRSLKRGEAVFNEIFST